MFVGLARTGPGVVPWLQLKSLSVQVCCWAFVQARKLKREARANAQVLIRKLFLCIFLSFISLSFSFSPVVSQGSVRQTRGAWPESGPRPVVHLVAVVPLLQILRRRGHVQGALLHQPKVNTRAQTHIILH